MTLEEEMELSVLLGAPVVDLQDRAERFITEVYDLTRKHTTGPREGVLLLAMAYVYVISRATGENPVVEAKQAIDTAIELLIMVNK